MSGILPQRTVDVLRTFSTVSVSNYGIDCVLKIVKYPDEIDDNDVYVKPQDFVYVTYDTKVWIEWSPNKYKLRKLGIFVENDTPMLAWFGNKMCKSVSGGSGDALVDVDIVVGSYFTIDAQYIPGNVSNTSEFEIVDVVIPGMHDMAVTKCFKIAPRRVKTDVFPSC